eukprot:scaffold91_cov203-Alexandrium_tamarense.AAC.30
MHQLHTAPPISTTTAITSLCQPDELSKKPYRGDDAMVGRGLKDEKDMNSQKRGIRARDPDYYPINGVYWATYFWYCAAPKRTSRLCLHHR